MRCPFNVADGSCEAGETTMGMAEEPEKLGVSAKVEILKGWISRDKPLHDKPMPCLLTAGVRDAR